MRFFGATGFVGFEKEDLQKIIPDYDYGHAFAYLWRRFGPPIYGSDPYKDLVSYLLTTKMEGVFLSCRCYPTAHIAFGIGFTEELYAKVVDDCMKKREDWPEYLKKIFKALLEAIEELKRPTNVRDWFINIEGKVSVRDIKRPISYSKKAGYGITNDYYKKFKEKKKDAATDENT